MPFDPTSAQPLSEEKKIGFDPGSAVVVQRESDSQPIAPPPIPELRAYKEEEPSLTKKFRQSKFVTEVLGPDPEQLLRLKQLKAAAGGGELSPVQQYGTLGAIGRGLSQAAISGPDVLASVERSGGGPALQAVGEFTRPGESVATLAGIAGAQKGAQIGSFAGPYGKIGGAMLGGGLGYGLERLRQSYAQGDKAATAGELARFAVNSPMIQASPTANRAINGAVNALTSGAQSITADQLKQLIDQGQALGLLEAVNDNDKVMGVGFITGALTKGNQLRPIDVTANKLRDSGFLIPRGVTREGANLASFKNAEIMEQKLVKANGLSDVSQLNDINLKNRQDEIIRYGYEPIKGIKMMTSDDTFRNSLDHIEKDFKAAEQAAPGVLSDDIKDRIKNLRKMSVFDGTGALALISGLRDQATEMFKAGKGKAGAGLLKSASAVEDLLERNLRAASIVGVEGKSLLDRFVDARRQLAINYATQEGIRRGGGVIPHTFAKMYEDGVPLTGELEQIGQLANNFPRFAKDPTKITFGVNALKQFTSLSFGIGGSVLGSGQSTPVQVGTAIGGAAVPYMTNIYNYASLTKPFQAAIRPQINPETAQYLNLLARQREIRGR